VPISYPTPPFYLIAFAISLLAVANGMLVKQPTIGRGEWTILSFVLLMVASSAISSLCSPYVYVRELERALFTSLFFAFYLVGIFVPSKDQFLRGFVSSVKIQCLVLIFLFVILGPWKHGMLMFSVPELRLWGKDFFPDWPNFYCAIVAAGFLLEHFYFQRLSWFLLLFFGSVLTTSRMGFLGIGIVAVYELLFRANFGVFAKIALVSFFVSVCLVFLYGMTVIASHDELVARLLVVSDRLEIATDAFRIFLERPVLGLGGVLFDQSIGHTGYASFHNSYLDVLVRDGLVGEMIFLGFLFAFLAMTRKTRGIFPLVLFLLTGSLFQNLLRHPHIAILLSVLVLWKSKFLDQTRA
jgi:hypothetical protein